MWKDEFVELLFSNDPAKIDATEAAKLKFENFPQFLYQYRPFNDKSVKSLEDNTVFLSDPSEFNDPYDSVFILAEPFYVNDYIIEKSMEDNPDGFQKAHGLSNKQMLKIKRSKHPVKDFFKFVAKNQCPECKNDAKKLREVRKDIEQKIRKVTPDVDTLKGYLLVSCFSEYCNSILMWSHYAKEHTGFCVKYDFKSIGYDSHLTRFLFPIHYSKKIFHIDDYFPDKHSQTKNVLSEYMDGIDLSKIIDGIQLGVLEENSLNNNMFQVFCALNKYEGWGYEYEWRYVLYCKNEAESAPIIKVPNPTTIYLGDKADEDDKNSILKIAREKNIDVYQMEMNSSKFALEEKKIN